jgi:hypothetical protein
MKNNFIAIGKIIFETPKAPWNIPHTHFIVNKTADGLYEATNIEFVLDSIGHTFEESMQTLAGLTSYHVMNIMINGKGHDELIAEAYSPAMEKYWMEYRKIEFELSRSKKDMGHSLDRHFIDAIKETLDENIKTIIFQKAKQDAQSLLESIKSLKPDDISLKIEYKNLEAA